MTGEIKIDKLRKEACTVDTIFLGNLNVFDVGKLKPFIAQLCLGSKSNRVSHSLKVYEYNKSKRDYIKIFLQGIPLELAFEALASNTSMKGTHTI